MPSHPHFHAHRLNLSDRGLNTLLYRYEPPLHAVRVRSRRPETYIVPDSQEGIHQFIRVVSAMDLNDDLQFPFYVIYQEQWPGALQFNVRVQGILAGGCLEPFGDWT